MSGYGIAARAVYPEARGRVPQRRALAAQDGDALPRLCVHRHAGAAATAESAQAHPAQQPPDHDGEYNYYTLSAEEERFIRRIGRQRGDHLLGVSQVAIDQDEPYRKGDRVRIVSGDLLDFEGEIVGWDLHHRKAILRSALFGGAEIHAAVELLRKAAEEQTPQR